MGAETMPAYELTRNPMDETHGFLCREHGILRTGLTQRHAMNVEAKHIRESHPNDNAVGLDLALTAWAKDCLAVLMMAHGKRPDSSYGQRWDVTLRLAETLTGTEGDDTLDLLRAMAEGEARAFIPPF